MIDYCACSDNYLINIYVGSIRIHIGPEISKNYFAAGFYVMLDIKIYFILKVKFVAGYL